MLNENIKEPNVVLHKAVPLSYKIKSLFNLKWTMVILPAAFVLLCIFVPMINLFKLSFIDKDGFTLKYLTAVFTEHIYLQVIWVTLKISFLVTLACLVIAYPVSYFIVNLQSPKTKRIILAVILIPFWISLLVRTFSWMVILQDQGIINSFLKNIGLINKPIHLLYNTTGVVIGMTHILLPYMILNIYAIMEGIDKQLVQVAQVMGSKPTRAFFEIFFPLSVPGLLSGSLLVFILSLGYFITPSLLGGANETTISSLIQTNVSTTLNWPLASAIAVVLFAIIVALLLLLFLLIRKNPTLKEELL